MKYNITISLEVAKCWIDDGFDATSDYWREEIERLLSEQLLPYAAAGIEVDAKIKKITKKK